MFIGSVLVAAAAIPSGTFDVTEVTLWDVGGAAVALVIGYLLAAWGRRATRRAVERIEGAPDTLWSLAGSLVFWFVMAVAVVIALSFLGFDTAPVVLVLLIAAVIVVLSGRSLLENYGASLILQVRAPFEPGDQIESLGYRGAVAEINGRTVIVETTDGRQVHLPNTNVIATPIVNLTKRGIRRSTLTVGVAYGTDLRSAQQILKGAVEGADGVLADPQPEVYVTEFDDSAINFIVRFWHDPHIRDGYVVTDRVAQAINDALAAAAIVIPFPQATLWWGDSQADGSGGTTTPQPSEAQSPTESS